MKNLPQRIAKKQKSVPGWGIKLTYRLSQVTRQAGEYQFKLRVEKNGSQFIRFVSLDGVKWERL